MRSVNVGHREIQNRPWMIELGLLRPSQHEAHAAAVKKSEARPRSEKQLQSQLVLVELSSSIDILGIDGNLPDARDSDA
jgi:hypothetical protein